MDKTDYLCMVQMVQEYIEKHLQDVITLKELANVSGYSPWHFSNVFKEMTGKSPYEYIRLRRLTKAALILRDEKKRVLDVALDFVFDSQEGFTRAFTKEFGISPFRYHRQSPPIQLFLPEKVYNSYRAIHHINKKKEYEENIMKTIFVQIIDRPERKCLVKRGKVASGYFEYCEECGCDVWSVLTSVKEALYEPIGMWLPKNMRDGGSEYVQGVELPMDYNKTIPEGYELIVLPPCTMMVFQGEPYDDEEFEEAIGEVWSHIHKFNPEVYGYQWAPETAPRFQLAPMGYRGYIEARPVCKC